MSDDELKIVDWVHFERSRAELGAGFIRILSYFREDGARHARMLKRAGIRLRDPQKVPDLPEEHPYRSTMARSLSSSLDRLGSRLR